jgi:asparagine synthase (glutamine-hydrolysing)
VSIKGYKITMCGFNGVYSKKTMCTSLDEESISVMNEAIKHRGPDYDEVRKVSGSCVLGHVRLSIIDMSSASHQPMTSECGRYSIVFNGEIYNYREIKSKLGLTTKSTGDTEVLLEAIAKNGLSILPEINGIFAFALYDNKTNTLTLARDRFGVKPAYFAETNDLLYFSSEIKGLTSIDAIEQIFDDSGVSDFLTFLCLPEDKTFFKNIYKIKPGEVITFAENGEKTSKIFMEAIAENSSLGSVTEQELGREFAETVVRQSVADVPLGLFLSGGVDSNGILSALLDNNIRPSAYTAYFESEHDSYSSEIDCVERVAQVHDISLNKVEITRKSFWAELDQVIYCQDEPLADPVSIPVYFLSKQVKKNGEKVIHVGEGADELFFGYEAWRKMEILQHLQYPQELFNKLKIKWLFIPLSFLRIFLPTRYAEAWRRFFWGLPLFWGGTDALTYDEKVQIGVNRALLKKTDLYVLESYSKFENKFKDKAPNKWMSYFDLKIRLPELMLMRVDKMAMAHGVEARVPFLDNQLADRAWNIPIEKKRNKVSMKCIFKKALASKIDDSILYAPKQGFNAPAEEWCIESKEEVLLEIKKFCVNTGTLNYDGIRALCAAKPRHLWRLFVLARWHFLTFNSVEKIK